MSETGTGNASAWGLSGVLDFFAKRRATTEEVYPSEWLFLKDRLREGISVLDVGCAQGGFASILAEHLDAFTYTGLDINADMLALAREKHPGHSFHHVAEGKFNLPGAAAFDLVLVLGILHLHETWRDTLHQAWAHTSGSLVYDLRESSEPTLDDKSLSYFKMDFNGGDDTHAETTLPYIIVNAGDALEISRRSCLGATHTQKYGYMHPVSGAAVTPIDRVMASVYCVDR